MLDRVLWRTGVHDWLRGGLIGCVAMSMVYFIGASSVGAVPVRFGGEGQAAGRISGAFGVALDPPSGDVYIADGGNHRIDKFDSVGNFLFGWGWRVDEEDPLQVLQTCTVFCQQGVEGPGVGEFDGGLYAIATDDGGQPNPSVSDVYVTDFSQFRVQKFDLSGKFLLMFGGGVNLTTGGDVCVAGEDCGSGIEGPGDGQFEWANHAENIAVGAGGDVYVGDKARIEIFGPSGVWKESVSLASLSGTGEVTALAVDSAGDMFVKDSEVPGVREFESSGLEKPVQFDVGSETVEALTLDPVTGDLFVADSNSGAHVLKYDSAGSELASFGAKGLEAVAGMAFSGVLDELYVADAHSSVWILSPPAPGPVVEEGSESASGGQQGNATVEASVNPEGRETTYSFEYVDEADFQVNGYAHSSSTLPATITGSEAELFEDHQVISVIKGLTPGATYHYRVIATNSAGTARGTDETFSEIAAALVEGPSTVDVASTSATLAARIDPLGEHTEYRLEYGTTNSYGSVLSGNVGEGTEYVPVSFHEQGLLAGTIYHYRLVVVNAVGTVESADQTFVTAMVSEQPILPDGRAWELVSPPDKKGAAIEPFELGEIQSATEGNGITYLASKPIGENIVGKAGRAQIFSIRTSAGWLSEDITVPIAFHGDEKTGNYLEFNPEYRLFSPDLSFAAIEPNEELERFSLSSLASQRTDYLRNNSNHTYIPLVNDTNTPPGIPYGGKHIENGNTFISLVGASANLSHIVLSSPEALTSEAPSPMCEPLLECNPRHLFEWFEGRLHLVSILPDGRPALDGVESVVDRINGGFFPEDYHTPVSGDGRFVVWRSGGVLYVRDMVVGRSLRVGGPEARFQLLSGDGSRMFFLENGNLFVFDTGSGVRTDLTGHTVNPGGAGVKEAVVGVSDDGSYVYFVASEALAGKAVAGEDNLYVDRLSEDKWDTTYIATLSGEDEKDWYQETTGNASRPVELQYVSSRVSGDGRFLSFMSDRSLTGYDNVDAVSGVRDEEVFEYDAVSGGLVCVSCDPSGARPVGTFDHISSHSLGPGELLVDRPGVWAGKGSGKDHWLAGSTPGWQEAGQTVLYQSDFLGDGGRLFFDSSVALVPGDTNGLEDVYEFEPVGVAGCSVGSVFFSGRSGGCVGLISSGTSNAESAFLDASEDGNDAFFVTSSKLVSSDYDENDDVYDAHVCSVGVPCVKTAVSSPPCVTGDSCKPPPSVQPVIFGPAPSATFSGSGNVSGLSKVVTKAKSLTRKQKLVRALSTCRKQKRRSRRELCVRRARKRYGAKPRVKSHVKRVG
jgi:hypothetical protein